MPKDTISNLQLKRIAAAIRWRGATLSRAQELWEGMTPADQQWWTTEAHNIVAHAGLAVAKAGA